MDTAILEKLKSVAKKSPQEGLTPGQVKLINKHGIDTFREELFKKVAENIRLSEILRSEINKEQDKDIILDKALKCISLMTGDSVFYKMNAAKVKSLKEV